MTDCTFDAPRRDRKSFAENATLPMFLRPVLRLWRRLVSRPSRYDVRHLSDHLARDTGLSPDDMARRRHIWPSESVDRPRI